MKAHVSVDDVIYSFMELSEKKPKSVFDLGFYKHLKEMNNRYKTVFTLYAFENYGEKFFVDSVAQKYIQELEEAEFIKIGFHGTFFPSDYEVFTQKCDRLYSILPERVYAETIRLHKYEADKDKIEYMKKYNATTFLCREDESRKIKDFPPSYFFSKEEENRLGINPCQINDLDYVKTSIRLEFYTLEQLENKLVNLTASADKNSILAIYTHERLYHEYMAHMEIVCKSIAENYNVDFTF